jgi:hypothetical protein
MWLSSRSVSPCRCARVWLLELACPADVWGDGRLVRTGVVAFGVRAGETAASADTQCARRSCGRHIPGETPGLGAVAVAGARGVLVRVHCAPPRGVRVGRTVRVTAPRIPSAASQCGSGAWSGDCVGCGKGASRVQRSSCGPEAPALRRGWAADRAAVDDGVVDDHACAIRAAAWGGGVRAVRFFGIRAWDSGVMIGQSWRAPSHSTSGRPLITPCQLEQNATPPSPQGLMRSSRPSSRSIGRRCVRCIGSWPAAAAARASSSRMCCRRSTCGRWRRGRAGRPPREPLPWLKTLARNLLVNYYRRRRPSAVDPVVLQEAIDPEHAPDTPDAAAIVHWGLARLSRREARLIAAFHLDRRSVRDIAMAEGASERAIEGRLYRARRNLRRRLEPLVREKGDAS